jgi:ABC-type glycerol-3-phosphate transport system permease component
MVLPQFVLVYKGYFSYQFKMNGLMAASLLTSIGPLLVVAFTQKYLRKGLVTGAVKL